MSKLSTINCDGCGKEFQKETRYIKAGQKRETVKITVHQNVLVNFQQPVIYQVSGIIVNKTNNT